MPGNAARGSLLDRQHAERRRDFPLVNRLCCNANSARKFGGCSARVDGFPQRLLWAHLKTQAMLQYELKPRFRDIVKPCFSFERMKKRSNAESLGTLGGRLRAAISAAGLQQNDVAGHFRITEQAVSQWVRDEKRPDVGKIFPLAKLLGVRAEWLTDGTGSRISGKSGKEALLIGKVGAGSEITRFEHPDVLAGIPLPPGLDAPNVAEIDGDSQHPLQPGWLIFYGAENQGVTEAVMGKLCVVQVKDGPTLLKTLKRGTREGLFRLESWNAATREDVELVWAARVMDIRPT